MANPKELPSRNPAWVAFYRSHEAIFARREFDAVSATELGGNRVVREYEYLQSKFGVIGLVSVSTRMEELERVIRGMKKGNFRPLKQFLLNEAHFSSPFSYPIGDLLSGALDKESASKMPDKLRRIAHLIPPTGEPFRMPDSTHTAPNLRS